MSGLIRQIGRAALSPTVKAPTVSVSGGIRGIGKAPVASNYVTSQTASSINKLGELGAEVPEKKTSVLGWLLENLPRTGYAASNTLREFTNPSAGQTPDESDPLAAWVRGFKKEETTTGKNIMEDFGMSGDKAIFGGGDPHIYNPSAAGLAGLALDIFNPADPLNWVGFGLGGAAKSGGIKGVKALEKSFGKDSAAKILSLLGEGSVTDIAANSVGKIIKQVTEKGKSGGLDESSMADLVNALKSGMSDAATNPKTKIDYWQGKPVTIGLQNPLTLGLKGNFAELPVPGSEHVTAAMSKGINKFNQTKVGDTLGEMFQYGHVSKDAPQRLFVKDGAKVELDKLIRYAARNKSKLPVEPAEIQALKNDLDSISISNIYNDESASGGYNFDTLASITGISTDTLMKMFDNDLPFTYGAGELFNKIKAAGADDATAFRQAFLLRGVMDRTVDLIPNEFRKAFKGTVMTPSVEFRYGDNSPAGDANIYGAKSPYINYIFEYKGVGIALPINTSENFNKDMWSKLSGAMKAIDDLPPDTRAKITQDIQLAPHDLGEYVSTRGVATKDPFAATFDGGKIVLVDADRYGHTLPHEAGHVLWGKNPELASKYSAAADKEINEMGTSIGVSDYGFAHLAHNNNYEEDFSEAVARLIRDPAGFITAHPERARVVQEAMVDGTITPEEAKAILERSDARAKKISDAYGAQGQLNSVISRLDEAASDVFIKNEDQTIDNKQAMADFTKDITRVLEKSISLTEEFQKVTKTIWKDVSADEMRQIIRMAASFDEVGASKPSFLSKASVKEVNDKISDLFSPIGKKQIPVYHVTTPETAEDIMSNGFPNPRIAENKSAMSNNSLFFAPDPHSSYRWTEHVGLDTEGYTMIRGTIDTDGLNVVNIDDDLNKIYKRGLKLGLSPKQLKPVKSDDNWEEYLESMMDSDENLIYDSRITGLVDWAHSLGFQDRESELLGDVLYGWSNEKELAIFNPKLVKDMQSADGDTIDEMFSHEMTSNPKYDPNIPYSREDINSHKFIPVIKEGPSDESGVRELFNATDEEPLFYSKLDDKFNPTFHSVLRNVIDTKMANAMPVEDLKRMLKSNGVKDEEVQWTFLDDFIGDKTKVSKADVQQWLDWNNLQIEEKLLGITAHTMNWDDFRANPELPEWYRNIPNEAFEQAAREIREGNESWFEAVEDFSAYYPPNHEFTDEEYEQMVKADELLERFIDSQEPDEDFAAEFGDIPDPAFGGQGNEEAVHYARYVEPGGEDYKELLIKLPGSYKKPKKNKVERKMQYLEADYQSPHFGLESDNLVAHTRFNTRYTTEGKKILFLEEIQSDWHQHGWKDGYKGGQEKRDDINLWSIVVRPDNKDNLDTYIMEGPDGERASVTAYNDDVAFSKLAKQLDIKKVADAPFKNTWRELVIKRMLKYASEEGFDGISWTSGAQQNKRWSQSEDVAAIYYSPVTKSLTTYRDESWIKGEGLSVDKHLNEVEEKDLKKYLTKEQIARLTDPTPLELKVVAKPAWKSNISEEDIRDLNAEDMLRLVEKEGQDYMAYHIVDQHGNQFTYDYKTEAEAQKAIDGYYVSEQNGKVITTGDLQFGGGGFRTTYDERIPQDFEKLTKKFKLKTEEMALSGGNKNLFDLADMDTYDGFYEEVSGIFEEGDPTQAVSESFDFQLNRIGKELGRAVDKEDVSNLSEAMKTMLTEVANESDYTEYLDDCLESLDKVTKEYLKVTSKAEEKIAMSQKGIMLTPESKDFFAGNSQPLFYAKTKKPDHELTSIDNEFNKLSEPAQNAYREFIKWRESVVKEYQKRGIPINVLEKYVPFVFIRKGSADEMGALNALFGTGSMPEADDLSSLINWLSGTDPNLKARTTKATDPTEVNKILNKPILSEDGAVIMATRGTRAIQAQELYDFADEFAGKYGLTIDEMSEYNKMKGYKLYIPKATADGRKIFEEVKSSNIIEKNPKAMFLPEEMVKMYNQYTDLVFGQQGMNKLLKTYDKATSLYKKLAYLWNPGHIMRDFTGNVFNGYLMGLTNPAIYKEAFDYMTQPDMIVKIPGVKMTASEFMKKCRQNGILDIGSSLAEFSGDSVIGIKKAKNPVSAALNGYGYAMRMGTRQSDTFTRMAGMIYQMKQGKSFDEASAQVKKFYFDYFELTSFERNVMKRIVPFYTWMRKNIPLQLEMVVKNPRELARISDTMNAAAGEDIDWSEQPEYIQDTAAFPMMNSDHYLSPNLPFTDLSRGTPTLDTLQNLLSSVSPLIRSPIELATNTQWFNGQPIEGYENEKRNIPLSGLLRNIGVDTPQVNKRGVGYLGDQIPLLRNLDAITDMSNPRQMEKASSFIGGPGLYKKESVESSAQYEYLRRLQDLIKLLKDQQNQ